MRQERKVVTVLFCDLVGFTARAEEMDPEDVAALLAPYHARLKDELERFGGTVEKFIGDAVMALFGAPVAHEDDPERAVRAALAIRDFAREQGIELRIGITTGEALVNVEARPELGETLATGDALNTASRLQAAAPVNAILVSEKTCLATKEVIDYRPADPVRAKGKAKPVPVWQALSATPLAERQHTTPLVGRESELTQLREALRRTQHERTPRLVTIVGEPGIGKSRLVYELSTGDGGFVWRKGRCLPYGDGVSFWALGEIVKQQAGILESDPPEQAEAKLRACAPDEWMESHLRPLVGAGEARDTLGDRRAEAFSAWRRFLTSLAAEEPLALVLEDVHWADDGLLDFVAQLVEWARDSPLLVLCTARPELLERRPAWAASAISLSPLSDEETERLLASLVDGEASEEFLARAAGNPLYAEQYGRLVAEGGSLEEPPLTVQSIIAARLDTLPAEEKAFVLDAAVIGRVFWSGALAALSGVDRWSVEEQLLALERREFVRRGESSAVEGDTQYAFGHMLLRDVAYAELPRAERAAKHVRAAEWIESLGRSDDHVELLAIHYLAALDFTRATGEELDELAERARLALRDAGERALALGAVTAAPRYYRAALDLWPGDDAGRPYVLLGYGTALDSAEQGGEEEITEARDALLAAGDISATVEAELQLVNVVIRRRELRRAAAHLDRAGALVRELGASRPKARFLGQLARLHMIEDRFAEAIELGRQALAMADELALHELRPNVLNTVGVARVASGDPAGVEDIEQSIEFALALTAVSDVLRGYGNLAACFEGLADLDRTRAALERGRKAAERFGLPPGSFEASLPDVLWRLGEWDEALRIAEQVLARPGAQRSRHASIPLATRGDIRLARDDVAGALADVRAAHEQAPGDRPTAGWLSHLARVLLEVGSREEAEEVAEAFLAAAPADPGAIVSTDAALALRELGRAGEALELLAHKPFTMWRRALELVLRGELVEAADVYAERGNVTREAQLRMQAAQQLIVDGRRAEAEEQLEKALAFWRSVGATRYIRRCEELAETA